LVRPFIALVALSLRGRIINFSDSWELLFTDFLLMKPSEDTANEVAELVGLINSVVV